MKTLYISDLDGTLLDGNAELSEFTINTLNDLIAQGVHFTVATARTAATSVFMIERLKISMPIILMNGVLIFDMNKKKYVKKEMLAREKIAQILSAMKKVDQTGFMYALSDDELMTYYERICNNSMQKFKDERVQKFNKKFVLIDDFANADTNIIYFCYIDTHKNISRLYNEIKTISGLRIEMYQDIYSNDNSWYMEVFKNTASKYKAVEFLRRQYKFSKVIGFGDNLNDLPLFAACDECYAVSNAKEEVKAKATAVIGANTNDGVAKWLEENAL